MLSRQILKAIQDISQDHMTVLQLLLKWLAGLWKLCGSRDSIQSENQVYDATVCQLIGSGAPKFQTGSTGNWFLSTTPSDTLVYNLTRKFGS